VPLIGGLTRTTAAQLEVARAFNEGTGFAGQFNEVLGDAVFRNRQFGVSAEKASTLVKNLNTNFTDLSIGGISQTENALIDAAFVLEGVGVSSELSTKAFQTLRKAFNQTDAEIVRTTLGLENFAEELGVSSTEIFTTFTEQMPVLAMFGNEAERVFRQTAAAAKSSGLEFTKMMSLFDATDTFEGSAQAAGQLNALLGGPFLNTVELTMAETPVERMQLLSQAFQDAGISVEDMSRRQRQAFLSVLPELKNTEDLAKLVTGDFFSLADATGATAKSVPELAEEASKMRTALDNAKVAEDVALAPILEENFRILNDINENGFLGLIDSAEEAREKLEGTLAPVIDALKFGIDGVNSSLGLSGENLENFRDQALASQQQTARQPMTGDASGQPIIQLQLFIDGNEVRSAIKRTN